MSILNRIGSELEEDEDNKLKAKEYLYGQSIAAEICNFGEVERCMIKHEINNIIFKYQINKYAPSSRGNNPLMQMCGLLSGETSSGSSSVTSNEYPWPCTNIRNLFSLQQSFSSPRAATGP